MQNEGNLILTGECCSGKTTCIKSLQKLTMLEDFCFENVSIVESKTPEALRNFLWSNLQEKRKAVFTSQKGNLVITIDDLSLSPCHVESGHVTDFLRQILDAKTFQTSINDKLELVSVENVQTLLSCSSSFYEMAAPRLMGHLARCNLPGWQLKRVVDLFSTICMNHLHARNSDFTKCIEATVTIIDQLRGIFLSTARSKYTYFGLQDCAPNY